MGTHNLGRHNARDERIKSLASVVQVDSLWKKVLEAERFIAHDPVGYLDDIRAVAATSVGGASIPYLEEALRCFTSGCHLASVLLLGVAAEASFLSPCAEVEQALTDKAEQARFKKLQHVKPKHRWLIQKIDSLPPQQRRSHLPESLDLTLTSLYDLIRRQRNELGHPQTELPAIDRELAFTYFKLFPTFIADAEALAAYCSHHGL